MSLIPASKKRWKWKEQILALYFGMTDPATPFWSRIPALVSIIYLISPIDLIPDFIPFAGWLDDIVIVPLLFALSVKLLPRQVRERARSRARKESGRLGAFLIILVIILILLAIGLVYLLKTAIHGMVLNKP
ncbi:MAG: YkvA family protein [Chitinophagales bacterium]